MHERDLAHAKMPFTGEIIRPEDEHYAAHTRLVDQRQLSRPSIIFRCAGVADVQTAIKYARENALEVAVRSGGHGFQGSSATEGGVLIDLRLMRDVHVDLARRTVRIRPGTMGREIGRETVPLGFAPVGGAYPTVGYGGLATVSGQNYMSWRWGNACDDILSLDMVLADGRWVTASATANEDLYWAARGAGDNFGIVTSFEMPLHPVPDFARIGRIEWKPPDAAAAFTRLGEIDEDFSEDLWWESTFIGDDGNFSIGINFYHLGSKAAADRDIGRLQTLAPTKVFREETIPYLSLYSRHQTEDQPRCYLAGTDLQRLDGKTSELIVELACKLREVPAEERFGRDFLFCSYSRGYARKPAIPSAFNRYRGLLFLAVAWYPDSKYDVSHECWADSVIHRLVDAGLSIDGYNATIPSYVSKRQDEETVQRIFGENYDRLRRVKAKYDPTNLFRRGILITPYGT